MKLNNNKVFMRKPEGKPKPSKKIDFFKYLYYLILAAIVVYVVYYFIAKAVTIKGEGFVTFDTVTIKSPYSGIVKDLNITKHIQKGQFLCNIEERIKNPAALNQSTQTVIMQKPTVTNTQITNLVLKIHTLKAQYKAKKDELRILQREYNKLTTYNSLGLTTKSVQLQSLTNKIIQAKTALEILNVKIKDYEHAYKTLPKISNNKTSVIKKDKKPLFVYINHPIYSSVDGFFVDGIRENNTPVKTMEVLFNIQTYNNLRIVGYFPQKYANDLDVGDKIFILVGDQKLRGVIKDIQRRKFDVKFTTQQRLKVEIDPIDGTFEYWKKHNLLKVKLRKYKW